MKGGDVSMLSYRISKMQRCKDGRKGRKGRQGSPHGFEPSHGRLDCTHWSQACFEVVARQFDAFPFLLVVPLPTAGFSSAWHFVMCRDNRSLCVCGHERRLAPPMRNRKTQKVLACERTDHHSIDIYKGDHPYL